MRRASTRIVDALIERGSREVHVCEPGPWISASEVHDGNVAETRIEYRAIYRVPWSILDPDEYRERGYMERETNYGVDKKRIREQNYDLRRSEESHAEIVRWEKRSVSVGEWETEGEA